MEKGIKIKLVHYFGDYGPANFWANISLDEVRRDFEFIKEKGFNTLVLLIPYGLFKPNLTDFESRSLPRLKAILDLANVFQLQVYFRIAYLWETTFDKHRTYEKFLDIYENYKRKSESIYEQDLLKFIKYFSTSFQTEKCFLSWEDFFCVIHNKIKTEIEDEVLCNRVAEHELKELLSYLFKKLGRIENLHFEQRTNGDFESIEYNSELTLGYYNYHCAQINWCKAVEEGTIEDNLVPEKSFIEWMSTLNKKFDFITSEDKHLILGQFNFLDNTFEDDLDFKSYLNNQKESVKLDIERSKAYLKFLTPILKANFYGLGLWNLWSTVAGHFYNGTFVFGAEGWTADCEIGDGRAKLRAGNSLKTNCGYARIDNNHPCKILLKLSSSVDGSKIKILFNGETKEIELIVGENEVEVEFSSSIDRNFEIHCLNGEADVSRVDIFTLEHKSSFFNRNREELGLWQYAKELFL